MIKVRFAPSPTGFLHIGGARTALFNWMYAKAQGGKFLLRIEDTDQERSKKEFEEEILDSMKWLGMDWDELEYQSKRFDIYREYSKKLLDEGKAYKDGEAVILTMPKEEEVKLYDLIRGEIIFDSENLKDQVLMKSDGSPTYSFACVVDDALMEVSHVIRGEDHISNTPKQIVIYQALGMKPPKYAHLPLIMGEDGSRLSKRTGAVAVSEYRKLGYLPDALMNYLMLLGWSPGNEEKVSMEQAIKKFSIKKVNKASAVFGMDKLKWLNGEYIKEKDTDELIELLIPLLQEKDYINDDFDRQVLKNSVDLFKGRLNTLLDFLEWADFIFLDQINPNEEAKSEHLSKNLSKEFALLSEKIDAVNPFEAKAVEEAFRAATEELGLKASDLVHPVRVAISGRAVGPGLFESMAVLGKEKTVRRLKETFE